MNITWTGFKWRFQKGSTHWNKGWRAFNEGGTPLNFTIGKLSDDKTFVYLFFFGLRISTEIKRTVKIHD